MHKRSHARELAFQGLFQLDLGGHEAPADSERDIRGQTRDEEVVGYALALVEGAWAERTVVDAALAAAAQNWTIERMAPVDRNILRVGAYELLFRPDVPPAVAIDEAVELAKKFGSDQSGAFVNGILDRIRISHPRKSG